MMNGDLLDLVPLEEKHVSMGYYEWLMDPLINRYLEVRFDHYSVEELKTFVSDINRSSTDYMFAMVTKENKYIGNIKIGAINWHHRTAEVGLLIGNKDAWGKGYGTEAVKLVTEYGFNVLNIRKLWAGAYDENVGSVKAFIKNGYIEECRRSKHFYSNGKYVDDIILCKFSQRG